MEVCVKRNWALTTCDHNTLQFSVMRKSIVKRGLSRDHFIKTSY